MRKSSPPYSLGEIFRIPAWVALLEVFGLAAALIGDGWFDVLSWGALAVPLVMIARALRLARAVAPPA